MWTTTFFSSSWANAGAVAAATSVTNRANTVRESAFEVNVFGIVVIIV
jgi:hypothetical protein